ncbi:hypothetical protein [Muricoccus pecuniae]|uniref:Uncharacterized protein n=1 Tax=Muricoccus pecuniae TaxID=693023 RepID=A0A840YIM8_9PROT|nr:hypothetical protein [Roseomonas pecuniae]MBB5696371.1 hypothetical protein [Roseomonas pecuniae]
MREQLVSLIERSSLHRYIRDLKKNAELLEWVVAQSSALPPEAKLSERVYVALHGIEEAVCKRGKRKTFNALNKGYRFCAPACECRREEHSRMMGAHMAAIDGIERTRRRTKWRETLTQRYGQENPMRVTDIRARKLRTEAARRDKTPPAE